MRLKAVRFAGVAAVVAHGDGQKVILDIGPGKFFIAADKAAAFEMVGSAQACALKEPFCADSGLVPPLRGGGDRHGLCAFILHIELEVILQIVAHARQIQNLAHARFGQPCAGADAASLQQLRRSNGAGAHNHFLACFNAVHLLLVGKAHAARAFAVKQNHIGERAGDDGERFTRFGGIKIAAGGGGAAAFGGDEAVHRAEAFLLIAVEIVGARIAGIHAGLNHGFK